MNEERRIQNLHRSALLLHRLTLRFIIHHSSFYVSRCPTPASVSRGTNWGSFSKVSRRQIPPPPASTVGPAWAWPSPSDWWNSWEGASGRPVLLVKAARFPSPRSSGCKRNPRFEHSPLRRNYKG